MQPLLPGPQPEDSGTHGNQQRARGAGNRIPTRDEILEQLFKLNGLVAMSYVSTAKATVMQRGLRIILDSLTRSSAGGPSVVSNESLADLCRADPKILDLLEPFLTDDQFRLLMEQCREDTNDKT